MRFFNPLDPVTGAESAGPWTNGDRAQGLKGSRWPHEAGTQTMAEVAYVIEQAGLTPSLADLTQLWQALRRLVGGGRRDLPIDGWQSAPPLTPVDGTAYVVKPAGTGDFAGQDGKIALRLGGAWYFVPALAGTLATMMAAGVFAGIFFDGAAWTEWVPTETQPAPVRKATQAEANTGTATDGFINPLLLHATVDSYALVSSSIFSVPSGVKTWCNAFSVGASTLRARNAATVIASDGITIAGTDAGTWKIDLTVNFDDPLTGHAALYIEVAGTERQSNTGYGNGFPVRPLCGFSTTIGAGQKVRVAVFHDHGLARNVSFSLTMMRASG